MHASDFAAATAAGSGACAADEVAVDDVTDAGEVVGVCRPSANPPVTALATATTRPVAANAQLPRERGAGTFPSWPVSGPGARKLGGE
ncbi:MULTISPECIES: hypothetical protein [Mycobacteriaceae]|uniref:hypothetical protein n=1 Tax=Mycolicibacterium TaxID=1866885 RepID=UPI000769DA34|nr:MULTISPECIES: hypothetical protein [Mycolicibacterium]MCT7365098.1 hypothetical protein [Mycolicibacterium llatzerense]MCT7373410.1 hypothetical protein [Mycolicibacterium llatzerense]MCX8562504.1 hypothetical protein [Mycolicibacterium mucogenicum]RUP26610.1 MAG: hypothetical protein EKK51_29580 [Mycolicibacterium sp.]UCZ58918.1 hypothetical protein LHJ73_19455 [Mycolicibacterium phocaicum]